MAYRTLDKFWFRSTTLPTALDRWVDLRPDFPALSEGSRTLTYRHLVTEVDDVAGRLAALGVAPGERVALLGANSLKWVVCFLAALRCGAIAVPLNYRLSSNEIGRQLQLCEPTVVLSDEGSRDRLERADLPRRATLMTLGHIGAGSSVP